MLNFTKNQILILELFFNHPDQAFYFREIARLLDKQPGAFQYDINRLVKEDILESYTQANSRFFKLNKQYPIFHELKNIFFKTIGVEGTFRKEINKLKNIKQAFIYGSFAAGAEKLTSDIDLFIIGSVDEDKIIRLTGRLEKKFEREVHYVLLTEAEFKKKQKENNSFLANILKKKIIKLK